jgi:RHS repeat-associated protein
VPQSAFDYIKRTPGSTDFFFTSSATQYRNDNGTGAQTVSYTYTWKSGTAQAESITTTLPTVTTAQNGPNSATTATSVYDGFGRPIWMKDQAGFIRYVEYDTLTGAILKDIVDVDTTQTGTFANLPSGWSTPSGGGLHLTTTYEVDSLGRATKVTHPNGRVDYTVYKDADLEVRRYSGWDSTNNVATGPTVVTREDRVGGYTETLTMSAAPNVSSGRPTGTEAIGSLQSLSRSYRNAAGQTTHTDAYFDLSGLSYSTSTTLGTENTHFYRTEYQYDTTGAVKRVETPLGTITRTVRDGIGRVVSEWVGTDDTPSSGNWSPTNTTGTNLVKVREYEYDGGGVGDGNVTKVTEYPGGGASARVTQTWFDWRNRAVAVKSGVEGSESTSVNRPLAYYDFDNLGKVTKVRAYDADTVTPSVTGGVPQPLSSSLLRAQTTTSYDELGRAYLSETYGVDPSSGSVGGNTLKSQTWFDARGLTIKTSSPGGVVQKSAFDGAGRLTASYVSDGGGDSAYSDADDVTGDIVLEQAEYTYDASGNVLTVTSRARFHDASGTGALGTPSSGIGARVSYSGFYYDLADRQTATVDVGTNGASSWSRPGSVPSRSSTVLVNSVTFDAAGRVYEATDAAGRVMRTTYDALGRTTKTVENYVNGTVSDGDDKTTEYTYNAAGMTSLTAKLTGGGVQTTEWVYGVTQGTGSAVDSNDVVGATKWPDPSSGAASSGQQETTTVNALGQTLTMTDRNGSTHTLTYDVLGRVVSDAVTTLGSGVDGGVRRIETAYDGQGHAYLVTSYDAASGGSVVNQVQRAFNGLGQLVTEWQAHGGAVNTSTSPKVQYAWSEMASGANHSRLTSVTYPSGYVLTYTYASGLNSDISRLTSLSDANGILESYDHLGFGTVVRRGHSQPNVDLSFIKRSGESNTDAGDQYTGLDRFGRVVDQRWMDATSGTAKDRLQYGYDQMGNRLYRDNLVNAAFGELYAYDGLNQLSGFDRGTLNGTKTGLTGAASATQTLDYDAVGNWESVTTNGSAQTRTHNAQNEITGVSGATTPTFDANGNMTGDETGRQFVYDAWNRLVTVKNSGGTTLKTYTYDGLNRRVSETASGTTRDLYYSAQWQVLEERVSGTTERRYVWSPVYVDALVLRDRDTDANGSLDERLYVVQDANFNVTALVNTSGTVVERYTYTPFGVQTVYDASYTVRGGGSSYAFQYGFQGRPLDATTENYDNRGRWYRPSLGRTITMDPIRYKGGDVVLYRWLFNAPTNFTDPFGLQPSLATPQGQQALLAAYGPNPFVGLGGGGAATATGAAVLPTLTTSAAPTLSGTILPTYFGAAATQYTYPHHLSTTNYGSVFTGIQHANTAAEAYRFGQFIGDIISRIFSWFRPPTNQAGTPATGTQTATQTAAQTQTEPVNPPPRSAGSFCCLVAEITIGQPKGWKMCKYNCQRAPGGTPQPVFIPVPEDWPCPGDVDGWIDQRFKLNRPDTHPGPPPADWVPAIRCKDHELYK